MHQNNHFWFKISYIVVALVSFLMLGIWHYNTSNESFALIALPVVWGIFLTLHILTHTASNPLFVNFLIVSIFTFTLGLSGIAGMQPNDYISSLWALAGGYGVLAGFFYTKQDSVKVASIFFRKQYLGRFYIISLSSVLIFALFFLQINDLSKSVFLINLLVISIVSSPLSYLYEKVHFYLIKNDRYQFMQDSLAATMQKLGMVRILFFVRPELITDGKFKLTELNFRWSYKRDTILSICEQLLEPISPAEALALRNDIEKSENFKKIEILHTTAEVVTGKDEDNKTYTLTHIKPELLKNNPENYDYYLILEEKVIAQFSLTENLLPGASEYVRIANELQYNNAIICRKQHPSNELLKTHLYTDKIYVCTNTSDEIELVKRINKKAPLAWVTANENNLKEGVINFCISNDAIKQNQTTNNIIHIKSADDMNVWLKTSTEIQRFMDNRLIYTTLLNIGIIPVVLLLPLSMLYFVGLHFVAQLLIIFSYKHLINNLLNKLPK